MSGPDFPPHPIDFDLHPPTGGRFIATFTYPDPQIKSAELENEIVDVKSEIGDVSNDIGELRSEISEVKTDVDGVRAELGGIHNEIGAVRSDINDVRAESALPRAELHDLRDLVSNFGGVIHDLREELASINKEIRSLKQEVRDIALEMRVQKKTARAVAWATGGTMLLALLLLVMLGWNVRNNINDQVRTALNTQQRAADSTARALDAAKLTLEEQVAASRELYLLTVRELDRFGTLNPQMQNRLIATLPVNTQLAEEANPQVTGYVTQRDHDVLALLRPTAAERTSSQRPVEAVVRLNRAASEFEALLLILRRAGSDGMSCHSFFKAADGLNKLQCDAVEPGRYDLSVIGFLTADAAKNPRPGYLVSVRIRVEEIPVRNTVLQ